MEKEKIKIFEKGEWHKVQIIEAKWIEKTSYTDKPQYVISVESEDESIQDSVWVPIWLSPRSKKYTLITAALNKHDLKYGDEISPEELTGKFVMGLWGDERNPKGGSKKTFLRFLPVKEK